MRRTEMLTAGGVTLAGLGALVGLAIGSGNGGQKLVVPHAQPVEVRTEIIRRTINVYRREHPHHAAGTGGGSSSGTPSQGATVAAQGATVAAPVATRTRSSGAGAVAPTAPATPVVSTRSSGSKGTSGPTSAGGTGSAPVKTRSSGASSPRGGSGSSHAVRTRSSGGGDGEDHSKGHDD
jgi:hypothetical protein